MLLNLDRALSYGQKAARDRAGGQSSLFGGGEDEDFSSVSFAYGSAQLPPPEHLADTMVNALAALEQPLLIFWGDARAIIMYMHSNKILTIIFIQSSFNQN